MLSGIASLIEKDGHVYLVFKSEEEMEKYFPFFVACYQEICSYGGYMNAIQFS